MSRRFQALSGLFVCAMLATLCHEAAARAAAKPVAHAKPGHATAVKNSMTEPAAQKLAEWLILRHAESDAKFSRYAAFIADNPKWPGIRQLRRRAEARLWQERSDAATVRRFTQDQPLSGKGQFALARTLLAEDDRSGVERR